MLTNQLILSFSHNRWHEKWSEKQSILSGFARHGNIAVQVEHPFDARTVLRGKVAPVDAGLHRIGERLYHFVPPRYLPKFHPRQKLLNRVTEALRIRQLKRALRPVVGGTRPLLYVWHPDFVGMIGQFDEIGVIYHKYDRYPYVGEPSPELIRREDEVIARSQLRMASSRRIIAEDPRLSHFEFMPNAAEFETFYGAMLQRDRNEPPDLKEIPRPRIGYVGGINRKIDFGLLNHIAEQMRDASIVLIGPEVPGLQAGLPEVSRLRKQPNVHFLGLKPFDQLPHYVANLDVGTIVNTNKNADWVQFTYPLKLHEYLACGLPVVSTDIPSVREFEDVVRIAGNSREWVDQLRAALAGDTDALRERRIEVGRKNSWTFRLDQISSLIQDAVTRTH